MKRALLLVALAVPVWLAGCSDASPTGSDGSDSGEMVAGPATVVVVAAIRGRQGENVWFISPDLKNEGGPGEFYIHVEGTSTDPAGPRTQCGLTQTIGVTAGWRDTVDFVLECPRAPQYLTVYTRAHGATDFRVTHEYVY